MPGSSLIKYSICCSLMIRSRASSRWRAANVRGESGGGGALGSLAAAFAGGGEACSAAFACAAAVAGTGCACWFLGILASWGAASGTSEGGIAAEWSW